MSIPPCGQLDEFIYKSEKTQTVHVIDHAIVWVKDGGLLIKTNVPNSTQISILPRDGIADLAF